MIKLGTQVKSKIHDDLTGSVVLLERSNNYAVVSTHIDDYREERREEREKFLNVSEDTK